MSKNTQVYRGNYDKISETAKGEVKRAFAKHFDKGEQYLADYLSGKTQWTVNRKAVFDQLVDEQYELQQSLAGKSSNLSKA